MTENYKFPQDANGVQNQSIPRGGNFERDS